MKFLNFFKVNIKKFKNFGGAKAPSTIPYAPPLLVPMSPMQESGGREKVMEIPGNANLTGGNP